MKFLLQNVSFPQSIPESEGCLSEADKEAERLNLEKELEIMREDVTTLNHKLCDVSRVSVYSENLK